MQDVILSDNKICKVRRLGLFELVDFEGDLPKPFVFHTLTLTGEVIEQEYDLQSIKEAPSKPDNLEPEENSKEWFELKEYELYQAALAHELKRVQAYQTFTQKVALYILDNCLIPEDKQRIAEPTDYTSIYHAATVPQLTMEALETELSSFFQSNIQWLAPFALAVQGNITQVSEQG
jgi:hypothetical protein